MKRITALVLAAVMVISLGACAAKAAPEPETAAAETVEPFTQAASQAAVETAAPEIAETKQETVAESKAEAEQTETAAAQEVIASEKPVLLHPLIISDAQVAQYPDNMTAYRLDWGKLSLREDEQAAYPALVAALERMGEKVKTNVLADIDKFLETIKESKENGRTDNPELCNETKVIAVRSDSNFFSARTDTFVNYGGAHPGALIGAYNYDTKTGRQLLLSDIICDSDKLIAFIKEDLLKNHQKEEFFDLEKDLAKYKCDAAESKADDTERSFTWLLKYDGIQIIFNQYDIAPYAAGMQFVDIKFAEHPELFKKGIELIPDYYVVQTEDTRDDAGYRTVIHDVKTKAGDFVWKLKYMDDDECAYFIYPAGSDAKIAEIPGGEAQHNEAVEADHPAEGLNCSQRRLVTEQVVDPYDFTTTAYDRKAGKQVTRRYTLDDSGIPVEVK